jgi:hypothetical protein
MKGHVNRGGGFRGVVNYLLTTEEAKGHRTMRAGATLIGGNLSGRTPRELAAEFGELRRMRPGVARPVWHCSLSLPAGERLTDAAWQDVAEGLLRKVGMNPDRHPHLLVRHMDTEHEHVHLVASRISVGGELWHGKWEAHQVMQATGELEREHGLTLTTQFDPELHRERRNLTTGQVQEALRLERVPTKLVLQQTLDQALVDTPSMAEFLERLDAAGVDALPNIASTGRMSGFSFSIQATGEVFKASQLGTAYSWKRLQSRLNYEQSRDVEVLRAQVVEVARRADLDVLLLRNNPEESDQQHEIKTPEPRPRNYLEEATQNCKKRDTDVYFLDKKPNFEQQIVVKKAEKEKRTLTKEQKQEIKDIVSRYGIIEEIDYEYSKVDGCECLQYEYTNDKELADLMQKELLYQLQIDRNYILSQIEDKKQEPEPEKKKERNYIEEVTKNVTSEEKIQKCLMLENDDSKNEEYMQAVSELSDEETKMLFDEMQRRNDEEMEKAMQGFDEKSSKSKIDWSL